MSEEFTVHRLRFGDWIPSPIKALAGDPFSSIVAVGRIDGDIEVILKNSAIQKSNHTGQSDLQRPIKMECAGKIPRKRRIPVAVIGLDGIARTQGSIVRDFISWVFVRSGPRVVEN